MFSKIIKHLWTGLIPALIFVALSACGGGSSSSSGNGTDTTDSIFLSALSVSPDGAYTDESNTITAQVSLEKNDTQEITSVTIIEVDSEGTYVQDLVTATDDADTSNGDDIAGDYIYGAIFTLTPTDTGKKYIQAKVVYTESGTSTSGTTSSQSVNLMTRLTDTEWLVILNSADDVQDYIDANGVTATVDAINDTDDGVLDDLAYAVASDSGDGVSYVTTSGILGGVIFNEEDTSGLTDLSSALTEPPSSDSSVTGSAVTAKGGRRDRLANYPDDFFEMLGIESNLSSARPLEMYPSRFATRFATTTDANSITSKSAILLSPYYHQFRGYDDYWGAWQPIKNSDCPKFDTTEKYNLVNGDQNITPEDFKTLSNYGIIDLSTHGDNFYNGVFTWWDDYFGGEVKDGTRFYNPFADAISIVIILTGYAATDDNKTTYETDLQQHRMGVSRGGSLFITPSFITHYNGTFPNSIVFLGSCRSTYNNSMANAFINKGAGAVIGFTDYVNSKYCRDVGKNIFGGDVGSTGTTTDDGVLDLTPSAVSVSTAVATAITNFGADDSGASYDNNNDDPAELTLVGEDDTNANASTIDNGGFEEGSATGWTSSGDYRVQAYVGSVGAQEGTYIGLISTGLGSVTVESGEGEGSALQQSFCVPAGVSTITYDYDFISEEPMCYVGSAYDDTFQVELLDSDGAEVTGSPGVLESVNSSTWSFLGGDYFYGGDSYSTPQSCEESYSDGTYHTGWQTATIDVSAYAGAETPITLKFNVWDEGDSIWDSAIVIDDVTID